MKVCGKHNLGYEDYLDGCPVCAGEKLGGTLRSKVEINKSKKEPVKLRTRQPTKMKVRQKLPDIPPPKPEATPKKHKLLLFT